MSVRELERFARDMHGNDVIYRAALEAQTRCRSIGELEAFFLRLGYDIRQHDLREAQGLAPPRPCSVA